MMDMKNMAMILQEMSNEKQLPPDSQKKIADFFVDLVIKLEKGDNEAAEMLSMSPQELQQLASQQTLKAEAFENLRSKASGLVGGDPVMKRYNFLIQSLNKHIWELMQDVKNTKVEDGSNYNNMVDQLQQVDPSIQSKGGAFQKMGYGIGRGVGMAAKIGSVGVLGATLGSLGLPAYAVGGIIGGGLSVLKNSQNTKIDTKTKLKQALVGAGLGAMVGYAFSKLQSIGGDIGGSDAAANFTDTNSFFNDKNLLKSTVEDYCKKKGYEFTNINITDSYIEIQSDPNSATGTHYINLSNLERGVDGIVTHNRPSKGSTLADFIAQKIRL